MAISPSKSGNNLVLYTVLAITLGLTAWMAFSGSDEPDAASNIEVRHQTKRTQAATKSESVSNSRNVTTKISDYQLVNRQASTQKIQDLFKPHTWFVAPPVKKVVVLPPPAPVAPPAPFNYMGKLEDSPKGTLIFLMANNTLYSVVKGEKINQQWRLDSEDANTIKLTYLPLQLPQVLMKSARSGAVSANNNDLNNSVPLENN